MDATDALTAASWIKAKIVVPIHYNTFPNIKADDMEFARQLMLNKYATPKCYLRIKIYSHIPIQ